MTAMISVNRLSATGGTPQTTFASHPSKIFKINKIKNNRNKSNRTKSLIVKNNGRLSPLPPKKFKQKVSVNQDENDDEVITDEREISIKFEIIDSLRLQTLRQVILVSSGQLVCCLFCNLLQQK